ncbi:heme biosynthesis protein HemY [Pseudovibrio exalbescens]|uniref:Heme biosynthesis protein HemY n=2 Tax=Pseudovibrio exalbescens TaxID=197461 RepID=A0A1U7JFL1_9HYPH|nr:heme biosynthesis protein HemY [Pseudovibrio exalbescens]
MTAGSAACDGKTKMSELPVDLTDNAVKRVAKILSNEPEGTVLRVSVEGGGCSGFQYKYDLVTEREDDDLVLERDGAVVLIDPISVQYMEGSVIDFVTDIIGQSFQIKNPQATAGCGCGTSFSI